MTYSKTLPRRDADAFPGGGADLPAIPLQSATQTPPTRLAGIDRLPPQARQVALLFAQEMGEDLIGFSSLPCQRPDCGFPGTALVRLVQTWRGERTGFAPSANENICPS